MHHSARCTTLVLAYSRYSAYPSEPLDEGNCLPLTHRWADSTHSPSLHYLAPCPQTAAAGSAPGRPVANSLQLSLPASALRSPGEARAIIPLPSEAHLVLVHIGAGRHHPQQCLCGLVHRLPDHGIVFPSNDCVGDVDQDPGGATDGEGLALLRCAPGL